MGLGDFFDKKSTADLNGVSLRLLRLPYALNRIFDKAPADERKNLAKKGFVKTIVTDGQDHFRTWDSLHKEWCALDLRKTSVPNVKDTTIYVTDQKGQHRPKTLKGNKAKEQFIADLYTVMGDDKMYVSIHDVGFGDHIHVQTDTHRVIARFKPIKSGADIEAAKSRLRLAFTGLGMDPHAALARLEKEDNIHTLASLTKSIKSFIDIVTQRLGITNDKKEVRDAKIAEHLIAQAGFTNEGGAEKFIAVHKWIKGERPVTARVPDFTSIMAYEALLGQKGFWKADITGQMSGALTSAARALETQYKTTDPKQLAADLLTSYMEKRLAEVKNSATPTAAAPAATPTVASAAATPRLVSQPKQITRADYEKTKSSIAVPGARQNSERYSALKENSSAVDPAKRLAEQKQKATERRRRQQLAARKASRMAQKAAYRRRQQQVTQPWNPFQIVGRSQGLRT